MLGENIRILRERYSRERLWRFLCLHLRDVAEPLMSMSSPPEIAFSSAFAEAVPEGDLFELRGVLRRCCVPGSPVGDRFGYWRFEFAVVTCDEVWRWSHPRARLRVGRLVVR